MTREKIGWITDRDGQHWCISTIGGERYWIKTSNFIKHQDKKNIDFHVKVRLTAIDIGFNINNINQWRAEII